MRAGVKQGISTIEDDFWTEHLSLFDAQFHSYYTKPQKVWAKFHTSEESYFGTASEIVPIKEKRGRRTYVMMQPYIFEPKMTLTIGIYNKPKHYADQDSAIGQTIGQPQHDGFQGDTAWQCASLVLSCRQNNCPVGVFLTKDFGGIL